jgi:prepilin-type N-terminal cleavage/methylation domain-containing protein
MRPRPDRHAAAFTLVELLVVIAISSIMFVSLVTFTHSSIRMTGVLQDQNLASHTARTALARFTREASLAGVIHGAEEHKIAFTCTDITGDGADDVVMYAWDSASKMLVRTLNGVSETFAENVDLFSLEYQYETETEVTIASPGDVLPVTVGKFDGTGYDIDGTYYINIGSDWSAQYFISEAEAPSVDSVSIRAKRLSGWTAHAAMGVALHDESGALLASGQLQPSQLTTSWTDIAVPMTWLADDEAGIQPDRIYRLYVTPEGSPGAYCGSIQVVNLDDPLLPSGCGWWFNSVGGNITPQRDWSMYFSVRGSLAIETPRRSTLSVSILKKIKATITTTEGEQQTTLVRTCKVVNQ